MTQPGLALSLDEKNPRIQNQFMRQISEGRMNSGGSVTLTHDGATTTTTVTATNCGSQSRPKLTPTTLHAAAALATTYISNVSRGSFVITHAATSNADVTFYWDAIG